MRKRNKLFESDMRDGRCEVCDADISFEHDVERGDIVGCDECGAEYVILALLPVRLKLVTEQSDD